jgi:hypothetical protein
MSMCCVVFSYYIFSLHQYFCLFTSSELCVSSPILGIIIRPIFVYLRYAVSVIGLAAHK